MCLRARTELSHIRTRLIRAGSYHLCVLKLNTLHVDITFVKTTTSESGSSRVVVDVDGTLGTALFDGSCV